jgi:hypothetical protein
MHALQQWRTWHWIAPIDPTHEGKKHTMWHKKPMNLTNSESDSVTPKQNPKQTKTTKKKKSCKLLCKEKHSRSQTCLGAFFRWWELKSSKRSGSQVCTLLKQMMLQQKREAKKHALLVVNLSHQSTYQAAIWFPCRHIGRMIQRRLLALQHCFCHVSCMEFVIHQFNDSD